jgi:hypothetical protein
MRHMPAEGGAAAKDLVFEAGVAASAVVAAPVAELPALRERPGSATGRALPPRFLRYSDEQTVVGLAAVLQAMDTPGLRDAPFDNWGVLAAPQFPGRVVGAGAFARFLRDGSATVSPHIIPHSSLHSLAGAISIGLGLHGPNFGVGGGPQAMAEGLTAALTFLDGGMVNGLWLVITGWDPEPVPDGAGSTATDSVCHGLAMALVPHPTAGGSVLRLKAGPRLPGVRFSEEPAYVPSLGQLLRSLGTGHDGQFPRTWSYRLPWGGQIEQYTTAVSTRYRRAA